METTDGSRSSIPPQPVLVRSLPPVVLAIAFLCLSAWQWQLAQADSIRRGGQSAQIDQAIRLDCWNSISWTMLAESLEHKGQDSSPAWSQALSRAPRDSEILIRIALQHEQRGRIAEAEALLLRAASYSKTWTPRWSLVNFYERQKNRSATLEWARAAAERGAGDLRPLFKAFESAGIGPRELSTRYLPANRNVLLSYLTYRTAEEDYAELEDVAQRLLTLVPDHPPGWPGLDFDLLAPWFARKYPLLPGEHLAVHAVIDRLIRARQGRRAVAFQNFLAANRPALAARWEESQPITNSGFSPIQPSNPLDWKLVGSGEVAIEVDPVQRLLLVALSGRQAESLDLVTQTIFLPANQKYQLEVQHERSSTQEMAGFEWELRRFGGSTTDALTLISSASRSRVPLERQAVRIEAEPSDRLMVLALRYRRPLGVARHPQSLRLQSVRFNAIP